MKKKAIAAAICVLATVSGGAFAQVGMFSGGGYQALQALIPVTYTTINNSAMSVKYGVLCTGESGTDVTLDVKTTPAQRSLPGAFYLAIVSGGAVHLVDEAIAKDGNVANVKPGASEKAFFMTDSEYLQEFKGGMLPIAAYDYNVIPSPFSTKFMLPLESATTSRTMVKGPNKTMINKGPVFGLYVGYGLETPAIRDRVERRAAAMERSRERQLALGMKLPAAGENDTFLQHLVQEDMTKNRRFIKVGEFGMYDCAPSYQQAGEVGGG